MMCCGKERLTAFCSECGKALALGPLGELLSHVERQLRVAELRMERSKEYRTPGANEHDVRFWEREELTAARWRRWAEALRAVVLNEGKGE